MLDRLCARQQETLDSAAAGREPDAALTQHLSQCASCREAFAVAQWMRQVAQEPLPAHAMPNPDVIWWKAQLLRRWEAERRVAAPIERMHKAEVFGGIVGLVTLIVWQWSGLTRALWTVIPSLMADWTVRMATGSQTPGASSLGLVLGSIFLGSMILAAVHRLVAD